MIDEEFNIIYKKYSRMIFYIALKILKDEFLAEDAMQNTFMNIYNGAGKIDFFEMNMEERRKYLARCVVNNAKNIKRNIYTEQKYIEKAVAIIDERNIECSVEMTIEDEINYKTVIDAIEKLPQIYYDVIVEHSLKGKACHVIARQTGIQTETIRKRLYRAKKLLKKRLEGLSISDTYSLR